MVVLHYQDNENWNNPEGTVSALNAFKDILSDAYPDTDMRIDLNCVTMSFSEFTMDAVPAFRFNDGSYSIPDTYRRLWLPTNPVVFAEKLPQSTNQWIIPLFR